MLRFRRIGGDMWQRHGWRTDVPVNLYQQWPQTVAIRWQTPNGDACIIPTNELRRVFANAHRRGGDGNKYLFRIDPEGRTIRLDGSDDDIPVAMEVLPGPGAAGDDAPKVRRGWGFGETEWHRETVERVGVDASILGIDPKRVVQRWVNSCTSDKREWLWHVLRSYKRPDVVFELENPVETVVCEVEPEMTLADGIAQLAGDYRVSLQVDRALAGENATVTAFLVSNVDLVGLPPLLRQEVGLRELRYLKIE